MTWAGLYSESAVFQLACRTTSRWPASPCSATRSAPLKSRTASTRSTSSSCSSSPMFTSSGLKASTLLKGIWLVSYSLNIVTPFLKSCCKRSLKLRPVFTDGWRWSRVQLAPQAGWACSYPKEVPWSWTGTESDIVYPEAGPPGRQKDCNVQVKWSERSDNNWTERCCQFKC